MIFPRSIYAIRNTVTGKMYIGSSKDAIGRIYHHLMMLRCGKHSVEDMQLDYDEYGEHYEAFLLDTIQTYSDKSKEYQWMKKYHSYDRRYGYNYKDQHFALRTKSRESE